MGLLPFDWALVGSIALSRLVVLAAAFVAETLVDRNPALTSGDGAPILRSLTSWDGWWYLGIVRDGYHVAPVVGGYHDYAFLPLWPMLVRLLSWPWPAFSGLVAVILSNVLFVVAIAVLVRLGEIVVGVERSRRAAAFLAISPFAAVFSMAYGESLFLVLSVAAFLAAERDRRALTGILLALAALTRLQGALLVVPIWLIWFMRDGRRVRLGQSWLLVGPGAALVWLGWVAAFAGSIGAYGTAQGAWGRTGVGGAPAGGSIGSALDLNQFVLVATLLIAVSLLLFRRADRIPAPYALVSLLYIGAVIASGILESVGRYVTVAFPNAWTLGSRRGRIFAIAWPAISLVLLGIVSVQYFRGFFVP